MEGMIGEIRMFGGNFAPRSWALCEGQLLAISSNTALFSILGTTFGGDGRTTFALPDFRGRLPMQQGTGPGLPTYRLGQKGGTPNQVLSVAHLPSHNHTVAAHGGGKGTTVTADPTSAVMGVASANIYFQGDGNTTMRSNMIQNKGGNQQFSVQSPYLAVNFIIALVGVYPSRS